MEGREVVSLGGVGHGDLSEGFFGLKPHIHRNCPLENESTRPSYNIQEVEIVGKVATAVPRIYVALEDH